VEQAGITSAYAKDRAAHCQVSLRKKNDYHFPLAVGVRRVADPRKPETTTERTKKLPALIGWMHVLFLVI